MLTIYILQVISGGYKISERGGGGGWLTDKYKNTVLSVHT